MKKILITLMWLAVAVAGGWAFLALTTRRDAPVGSVHILTAALCTYAIGYRFYSKWISAKVLCLDEQRATPCMVKDDGKDFVKTNKWIVFGHHFAAISGPGPLVGPVLAAQFGFLPGTLWILAGVVLGGAVQDLVILFCSMRRNGKSLGQMVKEEMNSAAGAVAMVAVLAIMVILLAVLSLVVVNTLAESPWGVFTVGATIPIAMFLGLYLRFARVGKVLEGSVIGVILLLLAVWGGRWVHGNEYWSELLTLKKLTLAWGLVGYGLAASVLPIWLLLAPRDYLSTFMKLGTIAALAFGIFLILPELKMPALTRFIDGSGPVVPGTIFPFCFITIACGAISGFHTLIASGTTPKIMTRESQARSVGYGAMCLESLVAIMAIIAACTLEPGVYLSMNVKGAPEATVEKVAAWGFPVQKSEMDALAAQSGEKSLFGRTGGAATLAVGMSQIFSKVVRGRGLALWYHFAIMFEALFILTTLDAGTRVGRYLLQDMLGNVWKPLGDTRSVAANIVASVLMVLGWGYFLVQGVRDPQGGINSLWPLFGIANQLLAAIALCLATIIILKMQLVTKPKSKPGESPALRGRPMVVLVVLIPLLWLLAVTMTAGWEKIFDANPKIGFLAAAKKLDADLPALQTALSVAESATQNVASLDAAKAAVSLNRVLHFNNQLDAAVAGFFMAMVAMIALITLWECLRLIGGQTKAVLHETDPVFLPDYAMKESGSMGIAGAAALGLALARELSGESQMQRAVEKARDCAEMTINVSDEKCGHCGKTMEQIYVETTESRFKGVNRCC